jgi:hypothetical protein
MADLFPPGITGPAAKEKLNVLGHRHMGVYPLVDGPTITVDISDDVSTGYRIYEVTLAGNRTLDFTGGSADTDGRQALVRAIQGAGGNKLLTASANVGFGSDITALPTLSTAAGKCDRLLFEYRHAALKYELVSFARGY